MTKKILFFDAVAPYEYNFDILNKKGLGASESYLLAVANELKKNFDVDIAGSKVRYNYTQNDIVFKQLSLDALDDNYNTIIIQRNPNNLKVLKNKYPKAKFIIWLHDFYESSIWASISNHDLQYIIDNAQLICVSNWHKQNYLINFKYRKIKNPKVDFIHFFIEDKKNIAELPIDYDKNKLCFFSAGHKGLEFTLGIYEHLVRYNPNFKLYIGNPTYDQKNDFKKNDNIVNLKNQTRDQVLWHMKGSLATLHLNKDYPETFGCVNAEANLMNTPVLCFDIGASKEILYAPFTTKQIITPNQYRVDLNNLVHITETIFNWRNKYPTILPNPILDKKNILEKWIEKIL